MMEHNQALTERPLVSVIVPIYNIAGYISQCLHSLVEQTLQNIEIICVDDESTDDSANIVHIWEKKDRRIVLLQQSHSGVSAARNLGLTKAKGKYILFMDGDDWANEQMLAIMVSRAEETDSDMVVCSANVHLQDPDQAGSRQVASLERSLITEELTWDVQQTGETVWQLASKRCVWPFVWNKLIRADAVSRSRASFSSELTLGEDGAFIMALLHGLRRVVFVSDKLYNYRYLRKQSATIRLCAEGNKRFLQHIEVVRVMARYLTEMGLITEHGVYFYRWMLWFLYSDFLALSGTDRVQMSAQLRDLSDTFGLELLSDGLHRTETRRLKKLLNTTVVCSGFIRMLDILYNKVENRLIRAWKTLG